MDACGKLWFIALFFTLIPCTKPNEFFASKYRVEGEKAYRKFSRKTLDRILKALPYDTKDIVHVGTGDGIDLIYLSIAAKLRGGTVHSFDYQDTVNSSIQSVFGALPSVSIHRLELRLQKRVAARMLYKQSDILLLPCNPMVTERIFGVEEPWLYQFVFVNKSVALCPELSNKHGAILEQLGYGAPVEIRSMRNAAGKKAPGAYVYTRKRLVGTDVAGVPAGKFLSPYNGEIVSHSSKSDSVIMSASMDFGVIDALKDIVFVKFTFDGAFTLFDMFDEEEQLRLEKRFTIRGVHYGTHTGSMQLMYGTSVESSIPIGLPIDVMFDRVPVTILKGLSTEFRDRRVIHTAVDSRGDADIAAVQQVESKAKIRVIFMHGWNYMDAQQSVFLEQCKHLPKSMFETTYLSLCHDDEVSDGHRLKQLLGQHCDHAISSPLSLPKRMSHTEFLEQLAGVNDPSHLPDQWGELLSPVLSILHEQDIMVSGNAGDSSQNYIPVLAKLAQIPTRLMELTNIAPPKRPLGLSGYISPSAYVCRSPEFRKRNSVLPCHVINPGVDVSRFDAVSKGSMPTAQSLRVKWSKSVTIGFVGHVEPEEYPGLFVHTCKEVAEHFQGILSIKCMVVGKGGLKAVLERIVDKMGEEQERSTTIEFVTPSYEALPSVLVNDVDLLVFPKVAEETFGLTLLEAMASHVPTVQFGIGGTVTFSRDSETSFFVQAGEKISSRVIYAIEKVGLAASIAVRAKRLVNTVYNSQNMAEKYSKLYLKGFLERGTPERVDRFYSK